MTRCAPNACILEAGAQRENAKYHMKNFRFWWAVEMIIYWFHLFLFLFYFNLNFYFYFILLYSTVLVLPYIDMNPPRVYLRSQTWTHPSHLPPHDISLGHPRAPAPSILCPVSNIDWRLISYLIIYMFQCHSPKSSLPLPLPQSPKDFYTSVSLLLSCIQGYRYHLSKFHIYICISILYLCFSFWITSLCIIGSSFIHLIRSDSNVFFLIVE